MIELLMMIGLGVLCGVCVGMLLVDRHAPRIEAEGTLDVVSGDTAD